MCYILNIQQSKNTVISNISIITFLNLALYARTASLLASRGLEAVLHEAEAHEAEAETHEAEAETHEAEARFFWPRGLGQASRLNITALSHPSYLPNFFPCPSPTSFRSPFPNPPSKLFFP